MLQGGGGLAKVTTMTTEGQWVDHYSKESIKQACLEEARAWFTQANDTPFLTELLLSDLGILGMDKTQFDDIATGSYQLPLDTPDNAQQLIPLLMRPNTIKDWPQILTKESHKQGWMKAKETMSSSFLGAHFSHYKAGATHKGINQLHTMLMDISLQTSFSYRWWKKGIWKNSGKLWCNKTQNYPLFKANFNQLNKFIGKEMMHQVEENGLVMGEQYGSQHGKSTITQTLNKLLAFWPHLAI